MPRLAPWSLPLVAIFLTGQAPAGEVAEPLLSDLPAGVILVSCVEATPETTAAIASRLGSPIRRLTNSVIRIHGRPLQVNVLTAPDEESGRELERVFLRLRPAPFCRRRGASVIEFAKTQDADLATKAAYELGLQPRPATVHYRIRAELAPVDRAEYGALNPLFNLFLKAGNSPDAATLREIEALSAKVRFGHSLTLRHPALGGEDASVELEPEPARTRSSGATITYQVKERDLRRKHGVPFIGVGIELTVDDGGLTPDSRTPSRKLLAATSRWPARDAKILKLAREITRGQKTHEEKARAILEWLTPGKNVKYAGETGSRWGTLRVLEQRFGHCWDFSDVFVTLARASGVPARQVAGWLFAGSGHVWAEYYREGKGWQQVDPTGGGQLDCGIYHVPYFTSEDGEMPILYLSMPKLEVIRGRPAEDGPGQSRPRD